MRGESEPCAGAGDHIDGSTPDGAVQGGSGLALNDLPSGLNELSHCEHDASEAAHEVRSLF
jgi:hypothetical protein